MTALCSRLPGARSAPESRPSRPKPGPWSRSGPAYWLTQ